MSLIGKEISDFTVQAFADGKFREVSKADVVGKWAVFFFYPADFTFVCPTELEDLANKYEEFKAAGCEIYSVSCDSHFVHKAWHDAVSYTHLDVYKRQLLWALKEIKRFIFVECGEFCCFSSLTTLRCV